MYMQLTECQLKLREKLKFVGVVGVQCQNRFCQQIQQDNSVKLDNHGVYAFGKLGDLNVTDAAQCQQFKQIIAVVPAKMDGVAVAFCLVKSDSVMSLHCNTTIVNKALPIA